MAVATVRKARTLNVLRTLRRAYPKRSERPKGALVDHLAAVVVSRETTNSKASRACGKLMENFVDWNEVRVARCGELERTIRPYVPEGRSGETARRLVYCLQQVFQSRGTLDLDGLASTSPADARKFLQGLESVDRDEVDLVLLLGLGESVMPVNGDMLRAGKRMGVISNSATKLQAQRALESALDGEDLHACYVALREHARQVCFPDTPACDSCTISRACRHKRKVH